MFTIGSDALEFICLHSTTYNFATYKLTTVILAYKNILSCRATDCAVTIYQLGQIATVPTRNLANRNNVAIKRHKGTKGNKDESV